MEATVDPLSPGSRLDADHPENGVLIPRRFTCRIGLLLLGLGFGDGLFDILQRKIELIGVELFRAPAELQALQLADQVAQPVILTGELRLFGALGVAFSTGLSE